MRYLQLTALTLLCTIVMSMCLMVRDDSHRQPAPRPVPPILEQRLLELTTHDSTPPLQPPPSIPEHSTPHHMPPALEQMRLLELGARNMLLY